MKNNLFHFTMERKINKLSNLKISNYPKYHEFYKEKAQHIETQTHLKGIVFSNILLIKENTYDAASYHWKDLMIES